MKSFRTVQKYRLRFELFFLQYRLKSQRLLKDFFSCKLRFIPILIEFEQSIDDNQRSNRSIEPVPSILISGRVISSNLLLAIDLQFGDDLWTIVWGKTVEVLRVWQIDIQNIDKLNIQPSISMYKMVEKSVLQLLFTIIMHECNRASNHQSDVDFISNLRDDIVKPLLKSFMTNETKCSQSVFYSDHFKMVQMGGNFDKAELERVNLPNIISFDLKLCH